MKWEELKENFLQKVTEMIEELDELNLNVTNYNDSNTDTFKEYLFEIFATCKKRLILDLKNFKEEIEKIKVILFVECSVCFDDVAEDKVRSVKNQFD